MSNAEEYLQRFNQVKAERDSEWNALFQELADYIMPRKSNIYLFKNYDKRTDLKIYNETAKLSNGKLAAGLYSFLCPADQRWFALQPKNKALKEVDAVKRWFAEVTTILFNALGNSNFNLSVHEFLLDLGCFGTACIYISEGKNTPLMFRNFHMANIYILENSEEEIDTVFRYFRLSARQAIQMFGDDVHQDIKKAVADNKGETEFEFVHIVHPREEYDGNKIDKENMPYASIYIDIEHKQICEEGGYREMPYLVSRFTKSTGSVYGSGPGQDSLATIKLVNIMDRDIILETERKVDPPWISPDEDADIDNSPGGITYYNPQQGGAKPEPIDLKSDIQVGREEVEVKEQFIYRAFYNDLFEILADRKNMTATEVLERVKERIIAFNPTLGRLQNELFSRKIEREFGILFRQGEIPPPPEELMMDPNYEIEYTGELAILARKVENTATLETLNFAMPLAETNPEIMDNFDLDAMVQGISHNNGVPTEWLRSTDDRDKIRAERQQAQQAAQKQQELLSAAQAIPNLSKAPEAGSPVDQLLATM